MVKNAFAIAVVACLLSVGIAVVASGQQPSSNPSCCSIVQAALESVDRIKTGEQRAALEKEFVQDGGLYSRSETRYTFRACPSIKIRVTFSLDAAYKDFVTGSSMDTVKSVSKPYIEYPARD